MVIKIKEEGEQMTKVIEEAMAIINMYPDIFPHMYKQGFRLVKRLKKGELVLKNGVVITFTKYIQRRLLSENSTTIIPANDYLIHQIASNKEVKGNTKKVLDEFMMFCKQDGAYHIFLTVRETNTHAHSFYERYGFEYIDNINWNSKETGKIYGRIYRYQLVDIPVDKFFQF